MGQNVNENISLLENQIDEQISKTRRGKNFTLFVGIVVLLLVASYFTYMTDQLRSLTKPEDIAGTINSHLADFLARISTEYCDQIVKMAPDLVGNAYDSAVSKFPEWRKETQIYLHGWFEEQFDRMDALLGRLFDFAMAENLQDMKIFVKTIHTEEGKKNFEDFLSNLISAPIATSSIKIEIDNLNESLVAVHDHLQKISSGSGLTAEEHVEYELFVAFKEFWGRSKN